MDDRKISIPRRKYSNCEEEYKTFSVRIKAETVKELDRIADESNRSRNELIGIFLDHCIQNYEIID